MQVISLSAVSMYICGNNFQFAGATTTSSDPVLGKHNISEEEKRRLKKS